MTQEDQATAIGRLAHTYSQAKARQAALLAECGRMANVLDGVARKLRMLDVRAPTVKMEPLPESYPEKDDLMQLLSDLATTNRIVAESIVQIKAAGL
jgi:hypothetical protein